MESFKHFCKTIIGFPLGLSETRDSFLIYSWKNGRCHAIRKPKIRIVFKGIRVSKFYIWLYNSNYRKSYLRNKIAMWAFGKI